MQKPIKIDKNVKQTRPHQKGAVLRKKFHSPAKHKSATAAKTGAPATNLRNLLRDLEIEGVTNEATLQKAFSPPSLAEEFKTILQDPAATHALIQYRGELVLKFLEVQDAQGRQGRALVRLAFTMPHFILWLLGECKLTPDQQVALAESNRLYLERQQENRKLSLAGKPVNATPLSTPRIPNPGALRILKLINNQPIKNREEIIIDTDNAAYSLAYNGSAHPELLETVSTFSPDAIGNFYTGRRSNGSWLLGQVKNLPPIETLIPSTLD